MAFRLKNKYRAELAALRQRDAVPVKVRFDVTAALVEEVFSAGDWAEYSWQAVIDYLAAHAVIDVPKGVPSDEELMDIGDSAYDNEKCHPDCDIARAAAIRDAVLASLPQIAPATPTDAEIEALARVLHKAQDGFYCRYGDHATKFEDSAPLLLAIARAAFAHIGRVPVGCELDVTAEEAWSTFVNAACNGDFAGTKAVLDLCRSRIRPVYECKECAETRKHYNDLGAIMQQVADLSRAALEGE